PSNKCCVQYDTHYFTTMSHFSHYFVLLIPPLPNFTLFPYTTLFRSIKIVFFHFRKQPYWSFLDQKINAGPNDNNDWNQHHHLVRDRKSTRLNSSHVSISYAVFCLKKKNKKS